MESIQKNFFAKSICLDMNLNEEGFFMGLTNKFPDSEKFNWKDKLAVRPTDDEILNMAEAVKVFRTYRGYGKTAKWSNTKGEIFEFDYGMCRYRKFCQEVLPPKKDKSSKKWVKHEDLSFFHKHPESQTGKYFGIRIFQEPHGGFKTSFFINSLDKKGGTRFYVIPEGKQMLFITTLNIIYQYKLINFDSYSGIS